MTGAGAGGVGSRRSDGASVMARPYKLGAGGGPRLWPAVAVLLAAVLVPTAFVLWFMAAAMGNERLAVRQRLTDVYAQQLRQAQRRLDEHWAEKLRALELATGLPAAEAFEELVRSGVADAAAIFDESGRLAYPTAAAAPASTGREPPPQWQQASQLELEQEDFPKAAEAYGRIAEFETDVGLRAQALQAQARCLARAGKVSEAVGILAGALAADECRSARDPFGRLIAPNALLYALQLIRPQGSESWNAVAKDLAERVSHYDGPAMPSSQRLFLMRGLQAAARISLPTLSAEQLAAEYAAAGLPRPTRAILAPAAPIWTLASADGRVVALFRDATFSGTLSSLGPDRSALVGARVVFRGPPCDRTLESLGPDRSALVGARVAFQHGPDPANSLVPFLALPASRYMPDWNMLLYLEGPDPFAAAAESRNALYLWTGGLGIALVAVLAAAMVAFLYRQARLTRLKNDLIATVSHELKTPLSSMRVLVDTLLEGRCTDDRQATEYLRLIAKENERLSRLIDNFLTFSRMERNKRAFELAEADLNEIVREAVAAVEERFAGPGSRLEVDLAAGLPAVRVDRDALVTVVLNLLDNAWKYSGDAQLVHLRTYAAGGSACIEVADNGIGMSRRTARRIFERFYQADRSLARSAGGCGLGLSIVKFILDAHGGSIDVASRPGVGSTFTVALPARREQDSAEATGDSHAG